MRQDKTTEASQLLDRVIAIARAAGSEILQVYQSDFAVETKDDRSPLTAADRASHRAIVAALERLTPGVPVWSEESATVDFAVRADWPRFWLVDPLDGTKEFIKRNGEFTVNIALIEGHEPILGVVHVPALGRDYYGGRGLGAFRRDGTESPHPIRVTRPAAAPVRVVGSRSHGGDSLAEFLRRIGPHQMVPMGSSLKLCLVAEGAADVYPRLGPTSEWDTAAAQAVVEAAGGAVTDLDGRPLRYNSGPGVLNPYFLVFGDPGRNWPGYLDDQAAPAG
ncbi:MAG: 3'(2'),5'-bisphosphate nucleotidase CysQ [Gammaproteobacteria bacterium]|nr:3'(2'),5'-bisphosphate nucleotidase CysQ [Gammaproteobacteria bacterium]